MDMEKSELQTMVGFIFPKSDEVKEELYQVSGWWLGVGLYIKNNLRIFS